MELGFVLLADFAESLNGKVYAMGAGWNMLGLPDLPVDWGLSIVLGIDVAWDETNKPQELKVTVEGPDGEMLGAEFKMEFEAGRPAGVTPGQDQRLNLSLRSGLTFSTYGPHAVVIKVGEREIGRSRFYIVKRTQPTN